MLQHEFETLYGKEVGADEFEVINGLYMLNNDETKEEFVVRYKKMSKADVMRNVVAANQKSKEYERNLRKEKEGAVARAMQAERESERLRQELKKYEAMRVLRRAQANNPQAGFRLKWVEPEEEQEMS